MGESPGRRAEEKLIEDLDYIMKKSVDMEKNRATNTHYESRFLLGRTTAGQRKVLFFSLIQNREEKTRVLGER